jgi:superfamily II DNA or RNA helicase
MKVFAREAFFIPIKKLTPDQVDEAHEANTFQFYKDQNCEKCPYFQERPCDVCTDCPNNLGSIRLSKVVTIGDNAYLSLPIGDFKTLKKIFPDDEIEIISKNRIIPMRKRIKFTGKLRPYQGPACDDLVAKKRGVLQSDPRSGKTVMATAAVCKLSLKTIIIAAQRDWLVNFHETFVGSKTQPGFSDINPKRIGFCNSLEDFEKYDVCLATYQTFLSDKGKWLLNKIRKLFSIMIVDEVHRGAATEHARVISKFACKYKWGLTGTPARKDSKYIVIKRLIGPILHKTETPRLVPRIEFVPTNVLTSRDYKVWTYMIRFLETNPKRLKLIAEWAVKDAKAGHMVLIPLARVDSIKALTAAINRIAGDDVPIAATFYGGLPKPERDETIQRARKYHIKVVVGNIKMLSEGINIPRASCLYQCTPSSNMPKAQQRFSRILTPMEGKPKPVIRVFADDMKVVRSCFRNEFWNVLWKMFKPVMTQETKDALFDWMNGKTEKKHRMDNMKVGKSL